MSKLCIDLCSGLGGFSRAFVDAGWEVITVDIDPQFNPTICANVRSLKADEIEGATKLGSFKSYERVVTVGSPPCNHFSTAGLVNGWPRKGIREAFDTFGAVLELTAEIKGRVGHRHAWVVENPTSILKKFMPRPSMKIRLSDYGSPFKKPTYLWGNVNLPLVFAIGNWIKAPRANRHNRRKDYAGIMALKSSAERAKMPYGLSQAVLEAVESQP